MHKHFSSENHNGFKKMIDSKNQEALNDTPKQENSIAAVFEGSESKGTSPY